MIGGEMIAGPERQRKRQGRREERFDADQFELNFDPPKELSIGEMVTIRGKGFRVRSLGVKVITLERVAETQEEEAPF